MHESTIPKDLEKFIDCMMEGIIITISLGNNTVDREIVYINDTLLELLNYNKSDLVGKSIFKIFYETDLPKVTSALSNPEVAPYLGYLRKKSGEKIYARVSGKNYKNTNYRISTIVNLNEIKEAEKKILISSRSAAIGAMVGMIAHQWRQPLSIMSTISSGYLLNISIGNKILTEDLKESFNIIMDNVNYLSSTIDDFRNLENRNTSPEFFYTRELIEKSLKVLSVYVNQVNVIIELRGNIKNKTYSLKSDLYQTIVILLKNLIEAIASRNIEKPKIKITLKELKKSHVVIIEDNAGGINEDIECKIFDPYFTTKHQSQGTGLGLYMAQKNIDNLDGILTFKNVPNGSCFRIDIPIIDNKS